MIIYRNKFKSNLKGSKALVYDDYRILNAKKVNAAKRPNGYLYILNLHETDFYKVGVSSNPDRRVHDISSHNPHETLLIVCKHFENVYEKETTIHESIKEYYIKNEWFKLPFDIAYKLWEDLTDEKLKRIINQTFENYAST